MGCLLLWFPSRDSHQKLTCHFFKFCSSYSRCRILLKSGDDRPPGRPLFGDMFCTLAAGFSWKVAMTGVHEDLRSDAYFAFSLQDSLAKSRCKSPLSHDRFLSKCCSRPRTTTQFKHLVFVALLAVLLFLWTCVYLTRKTTQFENLVFTGVPSFHKNVIVS